MQYKSLSTEVPININSSTYGYAQIQETCEIRHLHVPTRLLYPTKATCNSTNLYSDKTRDKRKGLLPVTDNPNLFSLPPNTAFSQILWQQRKSKPRTWLSYTNNHSNQFILPLHYPRHFLSFQGSEDHYICNSQNEVNESNSQRLHSNTQKVYIQKTESQ